MFRRRECRWCRSHPVLPGPVVWPVAVTTVVDALTVRGAPFHPQYAERPADVLGATSGLASRVARPRSEGNAVRRSSRRVYGVGRGGGGGGTWVRSRSHCAT